MLELRVHHERTSWEGEGGFYRRYRPGVVLLGGGVLGFAIIYSEALISAVSGTAGRGEL